MVFFVGDVLDAHHEVAAPHVADDRQVEQAGEPLLKEGADLAHVVADVLLLDDLDVLEARGAADRMA